MPETQTVTVDRISNSGNPIATEEKNGAPIHVPAGVVGKTLEVQLKKRNGHWVGHVADRSKVTEAQTAQGPTGSGSTLNLGDDFLEETFEDPLTIEQRESSNTELEPNEYPGKEHRNKISHRHD